MPLKKGTWTKPNKANGPLILPYLPLILLLPTMTLIPSTRNQANMKTNLVYMFFYNITGLLSTDQTCHFPVTSDQGHKYLVITYVYDANFITSVPIKN
jgi:hypothetical protein